VIRWKELHFDPASSYTVRCALVKCEWAVQSRKSHFWDNTKFPRFIQRHTLNWVGCKVKLSLCFLNWAPHHEGVLEEWRYSSTHSLTSALDGGEWSASRPRERASGTHWIGGWVGLRAVLDAVVKRKISSPRRESNPRTPIVQPVAQSLYRLSDHGSLSWLHTVEYLEDEC
jgi:hypothetical protein